MNLQLKCAVVLLVGLLNFEEMAGQNVSISGAFDVYRIVPNAIPVAPTSLANVRFSSGVSASLGNELTPTQVQNTPTVSWNGSPDQYYTLLMVDVGSTSPLANRSEFLHWQVVNIVGDQLSTGQTVAQYVGSAPPLGSGLHRYVFLVYQQLNHIIFRDSVLNNTSIYGRTDFSTVSFTNEYRLDNPIAGNFYVAQYDSYVPTLHRQLGVSKGTTLGPMSLLICVIVGSLFFSM